MKILLLSASPRKNSKTRTIAAALVENLSSDHQVEEFDINTMKIQPCKGCMHCRNHERCMQQDDMQTLYPKINAADLLIIASPTYCSNMPGPLKTLFDRSVYLFEDFSTRIPKPRMKGKRAIIITQMNAPRITMWLQPSRQFAWKSMTFTLRRGGYRIQTIIGYGTIRGSNSEDLSAKTLNKARKIGLKI